MYTDFNTPNYIIEMHLNKQTKNKIKFKNNYLQQLNNIEWKQKRVLILERDSNKCNNCENINNLNIHHTLYFDNKKLWDYDEQYLITLCKDCHQEEHKNFGIGNFKRSVKYYHDIQKKIIDNNKTEI
jgi:5-methylcytosine-specific restriction endonuclease McrA